MGVLIGLRHACCAARMVSKDRYTAVVKEKWERVEN
jgi:hypothetical protein